MLSANGIPTIGWCKTLPGRNNSWVNSDTILIQLRAA